MAEIKKYLDTTALGTLVDEIKKADATTLTSAKGYADGLAKNYDATGAANTAKSEAIADADAKFAVVNENVAKKADTTALEAEVTRATEKEGELSTAIDGVDAKAIKNTEDIAAINNEETGILKQAKDYAVAEDAKIEQEVADLEAYVGTFAHDTAKTIVEYINAKTDGIATSGNLEALGSRVTAVEGDVATIKGDYLKAADKTTLEGKITAEETARTEADNALSARIKAVEDDYLKGSDKTELTQAIATAKQEAIATILGEGTDEDFDTLKEVADWILSDTTGAAALQTDVATLKTDVDTVEGKVETLEGEMDDVQAALDTKVASADYNAKVAELEGADAGQVQRIAALEAKFGEGEGNVEDMISGAVADGVADAVAQAETKDTEILRQAKAYADEEDVKIESRVDALESASETHALKSDVTTLAGRVTVNEGDIAQLKTDVDAVEVKAAANETAIGTINTNLATKAAQTDLDNAVARIAQNETDIETLEGVVADKAEADDLDAAIVRIAKNETDIASLTSSLNSFTPITSDEVSAMFA